MEIPWRSLERSIFLHYTWVTNGWGFALLAIDGIDYPNTVHLCPRLFIYMKFLPTETSIHQNTRYFRYIFWRRWDMVLILICLVQCKSWDFRDVWCLLPVLLIARHDTARDLHYLVRTAFGYSLVCCWRPVLDMAELYGRGGGKREPGTEGGLGMPVDRAESAPPSVWLPAPPHQPFRNLSLACLAPPQLYLLSPSQWTQSLLSSFSSSTTINFHILILPHNKAQNPLLCWQQHFPGPLCLPLTHAPSPPPTRKTHAPPTSSRQLQLLLIPLFLLHTHPHTHT